eukprot:UN00378
MTGDNLHHVVSELTHEVARRTAIKPNQQQNNNNNNNNNPTQSNQSQQSNQNISSSAASRANAITLDQPAQQPEASGGCC